MENINLQYENFGTIERRALTLDYAFMNSKTYILPKEFRKFYNLDSKKFTKNISRNFIWFECKYVLYDVNYCDDNDFENSSIEKKVDSENKPFSNSHIDIKKAYNKSYILNTEKIKYKIPSDPKKRYEYATMITSLLMSFDNKIVNDIPMISTINDMMGFAIKIYMADTIRETFIATSIYDYFHCRDGSLLSILIELASFNQNISLKIKSKDTMSQIDNTTINKITIYKNGSINLKLSNLSIKLSSIDEIMDITILSSNYPKRSNMQIGGMSKKLFLNLFKKSLYRKKVMELYMQIQLEVDNFKNLNFEKYIENLLREKKENLSFIERANRKIRVL